MNWGRHPSAHIAAPQQPSPASVLSGSRAREAGGAPLSPSALAANRAGGQSLQDNNSSTDDLSTKLKIRDPTLSKPYPHFTVPSKPVSTTLHEQVCSCVSAGLAPDTAGSERDP